MKHFTILYNPLALNGKCYEYVKNLIETLPLGTKAFDITKIENLEDFIKHSEDVIIICGGDGTLNYFINNFDYKNVYKQVIYYPMGSGNDFYRDVKEDNDNKLIRLTPYIVDLPEISFKDNTMKFINGVGAGIDGYVCSRVEELKKKQKRFNYSLIAFKSIFQYKPCDIELTIDDKKYSFCNVYLSSSMKGRFYGGGIMISPNQDRLIPDISTVIVHSSSKLKTIASFPSILSGKHLENEEMIKVITGKNIHVKMSRKSTIQVDGEVFKDISEYTVKCKKI